MLKKSFGILALCGGLAACDVATHPVAVVGPSNTVYRGTATATLFEGGWFQVTNGGNTCRGQYMPGVAGSTVTFPVHCTNGLAGIGTATYETPLQGGGMITMKDGTRWQFIFGRGALRIQNCLWRYPIERDRFLRQVDIPKNPVRYVRKDARRSNYFSSTVIAQSADEEALICTTFPEMNPISIQEYAKFCGYLRCAIDGQLAVSPPTRWDEGGCMANDPVNLDLIVASYRTCGGDRQTIAANCPAARIWWVMWNKGSTAGLENQVVGCGTFIRPTRLPAKYVELRCLPADHDFVPGKSGIIEQSYRNNDLVIKLDE